MQEQRYHVIASDLALGGLIDTDYHRDKFKKQPLINRSEFKDSLLQSINHFQVQSKVAGGLEACTGG